RKLPRRMDAAGAMDVQNAPTAPWKTAQTAVSHSAHTHHRWSGEGRREPAAGNRLTHEIPDTPFGISVLFRLVTWTILARQFIWPVLRDRTGADALRPILILHSFRFVGLSFLIPGG